MLAPLSFTIFMYVHITEPRLSCASHSPRVHYYQSDLWWRPPDRERKEYGAVSNRYQEVEQEAGWYQYHVESIVPSQGLHIKEVVLPTM